MGQESLSTVTDKILAKLQEPDERGKQRSIGPSEIGGCPNCLAHRLEQRLTGEFKPSESNYAAWFGTAVHYYLEHNLGLGASERKVFVYHLAGYGDISGHVDLTLDNEVVDYKVVGKPSYQKMQLAYRKKPNQIPTTGYRVQQMLYAYAIRQTGVDIEQVNLLVFPKHSHRWSDVATFSEVYNEQVALKALERLEHIWKLVQEGNIADIPSDEDCYNCTNSVRIKY